MLSTFEAFILQRYFFTKYKEKASRIITRISIIGVTLGVMTLVIVLSVMNGFESDLKNALQVTNGNFTLYNLQTNEISAKEVKQISSKLNSFKETKSLTPLVLKQALLQKKTHPMGVIVKTIDTKSQASQESMLHLIDDSSLARSQRKRPLSQQEQIKLGKNILGKLSFHKVKKKTGTMFLPGIIIGKQLALQQAIHLDDIVTLLIPEEQGLPLQNIPRIQRFYVVGFYESGLMNYDNMLVLIDFSIANTLYRMNNSIQGLTIKLHNNANETEFQHKFLRDIGFPYYLSSWKDENKNLFTVFHLEKIGLSIILLCIILIASFNIISSLIMFVSEKQKDIAILKALGATDKSILKIFLVLGMLISLIGLICGEILGLIACWLIRAIQWVNIPSGVYINNQIPMKIIPWQLGSIAVVVFVLTLCILFFPAKKIASSSPIIGLKHG